MQGKKAENWVRLLSAPDISYHMPVSVLHNICQSVIHPTSRPVTQQYRALDNNQLKHNIVFRRKLTIQIAYRIANGVAMGGMNAQSVLYDFITSQLPFRHADSFRGQSICDMSWACMLYNMIINPCKHMKPWNIPPSGYWGYCSGAAWSACMSHCRTLTN